MRKFKLSVHQYRERLEKQYGFASEILVKEYAVAKAKWKQVKQSGGQTSGCSTKHCRMGKKECPHYHGCRDKCKVIDKRITEMKACPES